MFLEVLEMLQLCVARSIRWKVNTTFSNVLEIETLDTGMIIRNAKIVFSKIIWSDLEGSSGRKTGQANPEIYSENMCRSFSWGHSLFKTIVLFLRPYSVFKFTGWNIIPKCFLSEKSRLEIDAQNFLPWRLLYFDESLKLCKRNCSLNNLFREV